MNGLSTVQADTGSDEVLQLHKNRERVIARTATSPKSYQCCWLLLVLTLYADDGSLHINNEISKYLLNGFILFGCSN